MEVAKAELAAVEKVTVADQHGASGLELNDLQLALIGGGCGEVVFG